MAVGIALVVLGILFRQAGLSVFVSGRALGSADSASRLIVSLRIRIEAHGHDVSHRAVCPGRDTAEKAAKAAFARVAELDGIMSDYKKDQRTDAALCHVRQGNRRAGAR